MESDYQDFKYRIGTINDRDQLKTLGIISYSQFADELTDVHWRRLSDFLHDEKSLEILINQSTCFVCLDNTEIIGMAYFIPSGNPWDVFEAGWSYIRMVGVNPAYQRHGIARRLMKMCIEFARRNSEQIIALHTSEFMHAARHLYENLGFKVLREIAPRYGKRYWLYTMAP